MDSTETLNDVSMVAKTCRMREIAQDRVVRAFRLQMEGKGSSPAEDELLCFARLVSVEVALRKSYFVETPNPAAFSASAGIQATGIVSAGKPLCDSEQLLGRLVRGPSAAYRWA